MQRIHYSVLINAPKQKVWETMLGPETYLQWSSVFMEGSSVEGSWEEGSNIRFLGPEPDGTKSGMYGMVKESKPFEKMVIKYFGEIQKNVETPYPADANGGEDIVEMYTFNEKDGGTEVLVDIDVKEEYVGMFDDMWPKALEALKALAEK